MTGNTGEQIVEDILRSFLAADLGLPLFSSLVTGMLIGLEREIQGKPAGLRTHSLVCFAATLLTLAAARQGEWTVEFLPAADIVTDPTRMAHGILTGIGFLGAGVIFREGPSIHGLTTAASLWITAALGIVYGVGMYWLAFSGTVVTLVVLVGLRMIYSYLPRRPEVRLTVAAKAESDFGVVALRALLKDRDLRVEAISQSYDRETGAMEFSASTFPRNTDQIDELAQVLTGMTDVVRFKVMPVEDTT